MINKYTRPCLRWPGNKYSLLHIILSLVPKCFNNYHEPFLGSGSVFLNLSIGNKIYLSDYNHNLINFYKQVKCNLNPLINLIEKKENTSDFFYVERDKQYDDLLSKAAQLYYLNRTCFNGIYRINSSGKFNVPYGKRDRLVVLDSENLKFLSSRLKNATLNSFDFINSLKFVKKGDFIYLDPPYRSKSAPDNFLMYNEELFSWNDQIRLQEYCKELKKMKTKFVINNLYNEEVFSLFADKLKLKYVVTNRYSPIASKANSRGSYKEYLFFN